MLAHLRRQLLRQNQEYVPNYQEVDDPKDSPDGFNRLLTLMLGKHYTSHPSVNHCQHQKFSRYIILYSDISGENSSAITSPSTSSAQRSPLKWHKKITSLKFWTFRYHLYNQDYIHRQHCSRRSGKSFGPCGGRAVEQREGIKSQKKQNFKTNWDAGSNSFIGANTLRKDSSVLDGSSAPHAFPVDVPPSAAWKQLIC